MKRLTGVVALASRAAFVSNPESGSESAGTGCAHQDRHGSSHGRD